jgi:hypothetical protein
MGEIVVALGLGATFGLIAAMADPVAGAGAFVTVFTAVFTALEKRRERLDKQREQSLSAELRSVRSTGDAPQPTDAAAPEISSARASAAAIETELSQVRERLQLPLVDWERTLATTGILLAVFGGVTFFVWQSAEAGDDLGAVFGLIVFLVLLIIVGTPVLMAAGFWLGRTSRASGFLGAGIMGAGVSGGTAVLLNVLSGNVALEGTAVLMGGGTFFASVGGWLGYLSRSWGSRSGRVGARA